MTAKKNNVFLFFGEDTFSAFHILKFWKNQFEKKYGGDINIAEPKALIGFAGPRVIEQTVRQKLPEGFQTAEFLLDHGAIDLICDRREMRDCLHNILSMLQHKAARN